MKRLKLHVLEGALATLGAQVSAQSAAQAELPLETVAVENSTLVEAKAAEASTVLPAIPVGDFDPEKDSRQHQMSELRQHQSALSEAQGELAELRGTEACPQKTALQHRAQRLEQQIRLLESTLEEAFVPPHGKGQLISPQDLLVSRLFSVKNKQAPKEELVKFDIVRTSQKVITYQGPELRQLEGLVFMALINMAKDFKAGTTLAFEPAALCHSLFGYYDGKSRTRLKETVIRLMHAVVSFSDLSVHLAMRFRHPSKGNWTVMLDPEIVKLFTQSNYVWLDLKVRRQLPEGLATWLYGYVRSQSRLIPTSLDELRHLCGSDAKDSETFQKVLYRVLPVLQAQGIIAAGWRMREGVLHWAKPIKGVPALLEASPEAHA